jgi:hypothetical protein
MITKKAKNAKVSIPFAYYKPGRGEVIIEDILVKETEKEPHLFVVKLFTTKSSPTKYGPDGSPEAPNAEGSSWSHLEYLMTRAGAVDRALSFVALASNTPNASADELSDALTKIARLGEDGNTDSSLGPCPLRGIRLSFEHIEKEIKGGPNKGKTMDLPRFALIRQTPAQVEVARADLPPND